MLPWDRTENRICKFCNRRQAVSQKYFFYLPLPASTGELVDTPSSSVYDTYIEDPDSPHKHEMVAGELVKTDVSPFRDRQIDRTVSPDALRTLYALQIVENCAPSSPSFARKVYTAVIADYGQANMGKRIKNLASLSQAAAAARESPDPWNFWAKWWRKNRSDYIIRNRPPPKRKTFRIRPTRNYGSFKDYRGEQIRRSAARTSAEEAAGPSPPTKDAPGGE